MKPRYIIGGLIIIIIIAQAIFFFDDSQVEYSDFESAKKDGETVQILGYPQNNRDMSYNPSSNEFVFFMKDEKGNVAKVIFSGAKPMNFDTAPMVVAKGKFDGNDFKATEILTKCPSKYENKEYNEE